MISSKNRAVFSQPTPAMTAHMPPNTIASSTAAAFVDSIAQNAGQSDSKQAGKKQADTKYHHIWLIFGPAGCGKSTVARFIANTLKLPFIEGDEFHTPNSIEKMSNGIVLTDADRWDWLTRLREECLSRLASGSEGIILTCSALKRKYRDVIRVAPYYSHDVRLHFIYLHADEKVLFERVGARLGHYMGANMVHSQFNILEEPLSQETDVITVDVRGGMEEVEDDVLAKVKEAMQEEGPKDSSK